MSVIPRLIRMSRLLVKYRDPAWVSRGRNGWLQRYRGGTIVTPTLRGAPLRMLESKTKDLFFHSYTPSLGDVIVELGAEYGTETLFLSRAVGSGRVIAVEAHPRTVEGLREMVEVNGLTNVTVVHAAIGGSDGTTTISDGDAVSNTTGTGDLEVPALTFASLLARHGVSRVDLLKVNIEGAERALLEAMTVADAALISHAVVSCHDFRADQCHGEFYRTGDAVDRELARLRFDVSRRSDAPEPWAKHYRYATHAG